MELKYALVYKSDGRTVYASLDELQMAALIQKVIDTGKEVSAKAILDYLKQDLDYLARRK